MGFWGVLGVLGAFGGFWGFGVEQQGVDPSRDPCDDDYSHCVLFVLIISITTIAHMFVPIVKKNLYQNRITYSH